MLEKFKGCLLGAAMGDALGMPNESTAPGLKKMKYCYRRPYKTHPNEDLHPGQYTDDTRIMMLAGLLIADGKFNEERYAVALCELYSRGALRFPDGLVSFVCEQSITGNHPKKGVKSTKTGCLSIAAQFALACPGMQKGCERAVYPVKPYRNIGLFFVREDPCPEDENTGKNADEDIKIVEEEPPEYDEYS
jgi:hypothetical protein